MVRDSGEGSRAGAGSRGGMRRSFTGEVATDSSSMCEQKLGFCLFLLGLSGSRICVFLCQPALATGRPGRENHDEHLDAAEGLPPDNHHGEREERPPEARAL